MSDLVKRMKATLGMGVISDGDRYERAVAETQFAEAIARIKELEGLTERQVKRTGTLTGQLDRYMQREQELEARIEELESEVLQQKADWMIAKREIKELERELIMRKSKAIRARRR